MSTTQLLEKFLPFINKTALIGLSYHDQSGNLIKQNQICGRVIKADNENGITLELLPPENPPATDKAKTQQSELESNPVAKTDSDEPAHFILPADLSCWFKAPKGQYRNDTANINITDPDFLVTWDIYQKQDSVAEGQHQWWEWVPRSVPPVVGK